MKYQKNEKTKKMYRICDKCGSKQKPDRENEEGVENWNIYSNVKCECGGTFEFKII